MERSEPPEYRGDFSSEIRRRVAQAHAQLVEARGTGDDYLAHVLLGDLESLARVASEHSVALDGADEALARGTAGPA